MELLNNFINYLDSLDKKPSRNTVKNYKADVNQFIRFVEEEFKTDFSTLYVTPQVLEIYKKARFTLAQGDTTDLFKVTPSPRSNLSQDITQWGRISQRTMERHMSSLRKFFSFLKEQGSISSSPFDQLNAIRYTLNADMWHLQDFKRHLSDHNKSKHTIKNYILDLEGYIKWADRNDEAFNIFNAGHIEEYKRRMLEKGAAPTSINRKLSSLRQYLGWASEKGLVKQNLRILDVRSGKLDIESLTLIETKLKFRNQDVSLPVKESFSSISHFPSQDIHIQYSSIPPIRLMQKTWKLGEFLLDRTVIYALSESFDYADYLMWKLKGKPLFSGDQRSKIKDQNHKSNLKSSILNPPAGEAGHKSVVNVSKAFYAPLEISIEGFPLHKKVFHLLRHSRPEWYKKYHAYAFSHYLHAAILVFSMSTLGAYIYTSLNLQTNKNASVLASLASPQVLSFQGRLFDKQGVAVNTPRSVRFALYNSATASGSALLWQEIDNVQPDKDGNFSLMLGNFATGGTPIAQTTLTDNPSLWVGVTIENDQETTPRQPLPTVGLASDTQTLQGLSPITRPEAGGTNVVLALDSSGNLTMKDNSDHTFQTLGGQFKISGKGVSLSTLPGSSSDIQLAPDGLGRIDLQKPLTNSLGSLEINDTVNILSTSSADSALTINQDSTGPILTASMGGVPKFTINNDGGGFFAGNVGIGTQSGQSSLNISKVTSGSVLSLFTQIASQSGGQAYETFGDTDSIERFRVGLNAAVPSSTRTGYDIVEAGSGKSLLTVLKTGFVGIGTSSPSDARLVVTNDGLTTAEALKSISALQSYAAGNFQNTKSNTQVLLAGQNAATFTGGNVGIGTTSPKGYLDITSALTDAPAATISANTSSPALVIDNSGTGDLFTASSSGKTRFTIAQSGDVTVYGSSGSTCTIGNGTSGTTCSSDMRLKDNITSLDSGSEAGMTLKKLMTLNPVSFNWKSNAGGGTKIGFIAQEMQQVFPEFVSQLPNGYLGIDYAALITPTIKAVQEQQEILKLVQDDNLTLASQGETLRGWVASLSAMLAQGVTLRLTIRETPFALDSESTMQQYNNITIEEFEKQLAEIQAKNYIIKDNTDKVINSVGGFAKLIVGTVRAGLVETQDAIVHNTLLAQKVVSPLAEIDQIHTNVISPLASDSVSVNGKFVILSNSEGSRFARDSSPSAQNDIRFEIQNSSRSAVATIDSQGNASFSGQLASNSLQTQDATVAGTLRAQNIIADNIQGLDEKIATFSSRLSVFGSQLSATSSSVLSQSVTDQLTTDQLFSENGQLKTDNGFQITVAAGTFTQGLISLGPTSLSDTAIAGQLSVGAPVGGLILADNTINILGGGDLELQPLKQGGVSFVGGNVYIDTDGNLKVNGNAQFAKDVSVKGVLSANIISPLQDQDFIVRLRGNTQMAQGVSSPEETPFASGVNQRLDQHQSAFIVQDASGSSKLRIENTGDLVASGSGTFNDLLSKGLTIVRSAQADTSLTETIATASAGTATIIQGETERTIITPYVKEDSLIYITPTSDTEGITPYLARQTVEDSSHGTKGSFTIQISKYIYKDIKINWWIVGTR